MAGVGVLDLVGERQVLADLWLSLNVGTVDMAAVFHDLLTDLVALVELGEVLVDDLAGFFAIERISPAFRESDFDLAVCNLVLEIGGSPTGTPVKLPANPAC